MIKIIPEHIFNGDEFQQKRIQREVLTLKNSDHPNILRYRESFRDKQGIGYIVTEYANRGSLKDLLDESSI